VVGTRFSVAVQQRCSVVGVQQGIVRVTAMAGAAQPLRAGEERTFCAPPFPPGELDEGGRLVQQALDLLAAGVELERADGLLSRYLQRYPGGPFAEEALFHRVFVMQRLGQPQRARALARQFLQRFSATPRAARIRDWLRTQEAPP
jgi:TolA-binding protein